MTLRSSAPSSSCQTFSCPLNEVDKGYTWGSDFGGIKCNKLPGVPLADADREEDEELKRNDGAEFFFLFLVSKHDWQCRFTLTHAEALYSFTS